MKNKLLTSVSTGPLWVALGAYFRVVHRQNASHEPDVAGG